MYRRQTTVTYLLNGSPISPSFGPPYTWATTASAPGAFSITAQAVDSRGGQTVSTPITLTIAVPTSVVITSPANGGTYAVGQALTIAASASDPDGVARVEFTYNGGNPLGTVATPPYQIVLPVSLASSMTPFRLFLRDISFHPAILFRSLGVGVPAGVPDTLSDDRSASRDRGQEVR